MNYGAFETDHIFKNSRESRLYAKKSRIDEIAGFLETTCQNAVPPYVSLINSAKIRTMSH